MSLVSLALLLDDARSAGYGVGAFNAITLESAEAIVEAAESVSSPVVVQVSENAVRYHGALEPLATACRAVAQAARVPVALHLDHATTPDLCRAGVEIGFGSVMLDLSALAYEANVRRTAGLVTWAHTRGIVVEAELGVVGGKDGVHAPGARTDPADARRFVAATGVDALAVAVGSSHAMHSRTAVLDLALVARLRAVVPVPLVLHGASGVPDDVLAQAVRQGITKVNLATLMNRAFTAAVRGRLADDPEAVDPRRYLAEGRRAMASEIARILSLLGSAGRARDGALAASTGQAT